MSAAYLGALIFSTGSMLLIDARWKLFLWQAPRRALVVLASGLALFLLWDSAGIRTGAFSMGESAAMTGITLAPEFPLEELFFITFLCYLTMVLFGVVDRVRAAEKAASAGAGRTAGAPEVRAGRRPS